jgi:hypothetical protein
MRRPPGPLLLTFALLPGCESQGLGWHGGPGPALADYRAAFASEVGEEFTAAASLRALQAELRTSRVLWLGDHHRDRRLHDLQRGLLRELHAAGFGLVLGLEAIAAEDEAMVREWLEGRLGFVALRTAVRARWPGSWFDSDEVDAEHYRLLLEFAKSTASPLFALEPAPRLPLGHRDAVIAAAVRRAAATFPDRLVVAVVGQTHLLGHGDLPARTGLPALALGGVPPPALQVAARRPGADARFLQSRGGLWFFAGLLAP